MDEYKITAKTTDITLKITQVGKDLDIIISGGVEHIGCVGIVTKNSYSINTIENHREDDIIIPLAKKLSKLTDKTIVIKAGIHLDNITSDEIKSILGCTEEILNIIINYI